MFRSDSIMKDGVISYAEYLRQEGAQKCQLNSQNEVAGWLQD